MRDGGGLIIEDLSLLIKRYIPSAAHEVYKENVQITVDTGELVLQGNLAPHLAISSVK